jgi:hypothetical protein
VKFGISVINKIYRTSAINGIIGFIEILSPINFSLLQPRHQHLLHAVRPVMRPLHAGGVACLQSSTAIGCARVVCSNNAGVFIICNYYPPGIVIGQSPY